MRKQIFVTGGVVSGLGKGITAASLACLLKARGFKVTMQKLDPYMNVDPGTMSPYQHGEVFVTDDGSETDLDLGHYERFIDENLTSLSNLTSGKVYSAVIDKERKGEYLGSTVQIIPHVTNLIKEYVYSIGEKTNADVVITEIGGTIGDIESQPFLEAARQIAMEIGRENCLFVHTVLIPYLRCSGEYKTKPAQHSVKELQSMGIMCDILVARSEDRLDDSILSKLALFCNISKESVIGCEDMPSLYSIPLILHDRGLDSIAVKKLSLRETVPNLSLWIAINNIKIDKRVRIAIVGKYTALHDAYLSVVEALMHGAIANAAGLEISWIESENIEAKGAEAVLSGIDGILVPGGFGIRGTEGMIQASRYARERKIPYFGICLGMQIAVIEAARDMAHMQGADSTEFNPDTPYPVISLMENQKTVSKKGGSMRLGAYPCHIKGNTLLEGIYGQSEISERHRHRYEVNYEYIDRLEKAGVVFSGMSPDGKLAEAIEIPGSFFVAVQFHPEFKSRPVKPHPLFSSFIKASLEG